MHESHLHRHIHLFHLYLDSEFLATSYVLEHGDIILYVHGLENPFLAPYHVIRMFSSPAQIYLLNFFSNINGN